MRLHLVRHGETVHNRSNRIQGDLLDAGLNEAGRAQADALARRYADERTRLAAVASSPLRRAFETGLAVTQALGLPEPLRCPGMREISWGEHNGKENAGETGADMARILRAWDAGDVRAHAPGSETLAQVQARALGELARLEAAHPKGDVMLVGHGRVNKVLLSTLVHGDLLHMEAFQQGNASATVLEREGARWRVVGYRPVPGALEERH
ncbi:MAG TPA: histidine phosphatase family protein [Candidatus Thermoplasmatota archaeon]|nr:histidine phosphatase family protein [Candidatus Thermoplasmatota archaeon]